MTHLSEEQLYTVMDAQNSGEAAAHVVGCAQCRAEVDAMRGSVGSLRDAATGLARSEFRPLLAVRRTGYFGSVRLAWPLALAAAGVVCAASVTLVHRPAANGAAQVEAVGKPAPAEADDALLDGINQDLSTSIPPSLAPLDVNSGESTATAAKAD